MALKLDNSLLEELGLGSLPEGEKQLLLRQIYERLEMNVGMRLADQMSNEQLDAFEKFVDASDDKGAFTWLETNFPNYKDVVNEEFEKLKTEIRSVAPQILASAQQNAQQGGQQSPAPVPGMPPQATGSAQFSQQPPQQPAFNQNPYGPAQSPSYGQQSSYGAPAPQSQPQPQQQQYGQPAYGTQGEQPYQQPSYAPQAQGAPSSPSPVGQPANGAMPTNGHLQPQYGSPFAASPNPFPSQPQQQAPTQPSFGGGFAPSQDPTTAGSQFPPSPLPPASPPPPPPAQQ